jgi:hypothetical protein
MSYVFTAAMTLAESSREVVSSKNTRIQLPPVPSRIQPITTACKPLYKYAWALSNPKAVPEILRPAGSIPKAIVRVNSP